MPAIRCVLILCVFAGLILANATARAEPRDKQLELAGEAKPNLGEPEAVAKARARLLFEKGVTAYRDGRFYDAVDIFLETNRLYPDPKLSFNVGKAFEGLGNPPGALRYYREYLRRLPDAPDARDVEGHVHQLEQTLSQKGLQQMTVLSSPDGATVKLDGQAVGITPWTGESFAGKHRIILEAAGYQRSEGVVELELLRASDFSFGLKQTPASPSADSKGPRLPVPAPPKLSTLTLATLASGVALLGTALIAQVASTGDSPGISRSAAFFGGCGAGVSVLGGLMLYFDLTPSANSGQASGVSWGAAGLEHGMSR